MKKLILLLGLIMTAMPVFAEKVPVKIAPTRVISTHNDEVEIGDKINFEIAKDVYADKKLYIKQGTKIVGIVDYLTENGWVADNAEIQFKRFYTTDVDGKGVKIEYPLTIDGRKERGDSIKNTALENHPHLHSVIIPVKHFYYGVGYAFRGAEIYVVPDTKTFNLFMETP